MLLLQNRTAYCNKLFYIERELKGLTADIRRTERFRRETPVWNGFWVWLDTVHPVSGSNLEKAVNYAYNHKDTLHNYMLDGRREISNNAAEHCSSLIDVVTITSENHGPLPLQA